MQSKTDTPPTWRVMSREEWRKLMMAHHDTEKYGQLADHDAALRSRLARAEEALRFYANRQNWIAGRIGKMLATPNAEWDVGEMARIYFGIAAAEKGEG